MQYPQKNPLPIPAIGEYQKVKGTLESVFDWHYELKRSKLLDLYEKGKANTWNATELAWDTEVDIEKMVSQRQMMGGGGMINQLLAPPRWPPLSSLRSAQSRQLPQLHRSSPRRIRSSRPRARCV